MRPVLSWDVMWRRLVVATNLRYILSKMTEGLNYTKVEA